MNHSGVEHAQMQRRKLLEENEQIVSKKRKLIAKYEELRKHIYKVMILILQSNF